MKIPGFLGEYIDGFLDLIYPSKTICYICGGSLTEGGRHSLCHACYQALPHIPYHSCIKCSSPLMMIEDGPSCQQCIGSNYYFDRALSVVKYEGQVKKLIYKFKYNNNTYLARTLGAIMADKFKEEGLGAQLIIPVPLHRLKEKERGFNQARLLGKYIARETGVDLNIGVLIRRKNTRVMHNLSKRERLENVKGAFKLTDKGVILNKDILLVDDIFTTGATANSCSKELIDGGARSVTVMTFAKG